MILSRAKGQMGETGHTSSWALISEDKVKMYY